MRRISWVLAVLFGGVVAACSRSHGSNPTPTPTPSPSPTPTPALCANPATQIVYALDDAGELLSFDPTAVAGTAHGFARIGTPVCPTGSAIPPFTDPATPYSMSVDDLGHAWILYTSGELFLVSTSSASCASTAFTPSQTTGSVTWSLFGQGFSTDSTSSPNERLWIAGGNPDGSRGDLGVVDPSTLKVQQVGAVGGSNALHPDLMGLSDATLWGFFPGNAGGSVQQIDKSSGALLGTPHSITLSSATLSAWAAAQWGGRFYLFFSESGTTTNETIRTVDRSTGNQAVVAQNLPFTIVSAASSTCAPVVGP